MPFLVCGLDWTEIIICVPVQYRVLVQYRVPVQYRVLVQYAV